MRTPLAACFLLALSCAVASQDSAPDKNKKSVADQLEAIRKEQKAQQAALSKQLEKIQAELDQLESRTVERFVELVKKHPKDKGIYPALEYLIFKETPHAGLALGLVQAHHLSSPQLGRLCLFLVDGEEINQPRTEKLLRAAVAKSPHADVQGLARFALARLLVARTESDALDDAGRAAARAEAEKLLDVVLSKHGKLPLPSPDEEEKLVAAQARPLLFELRHLLPGKAIPELKGADLDGKPLRLGEFKGQVVLLYFWSFSCGACGDMLPHLRALIKRKAGKPFALVGVNDDEEDDLKEQLKKEPIPWRSLRNRRGEEGATVAAEWNLKGWPTLYLIDHKGVIRQRWLGTPGSRALDRAIDALVAEAKKD
jgi:peroxiredoxin